jgi:hypothetical protein
VTDGSEVPVLSPNRAKLFARKSPKWAVLLVLVGLALFAVVIYLFRVCDPYPPTEVVVSACREPAQGMHRITSDFGTHFDVPEKLFTVTAATHDMPPERFYMLRVKDSAATMVIAHDVGMWVDLKKAFPVFSRHIEERAVRAANQRSLGTDHWGYLKGGERWRYVAFSTRDAIGYRPVPAKEAELFDQVIGSACH